MKLGKDGHGGWGGVLISSNSPQFLFFLRHTYFPAPGSRISCLLQGWKRDWKLSSSQCDSGPGSSLGGWLCSLFLQLSRAKSWVSYRTMDQSAWMAESPHRGQLPRNISWPSGDPERVRINHQAPRILHTTQSHNSFISISLFKDQYVDYYARPDTYKTNVRTYIGDFKWLISPKSEQRNERFYQVSRGKANLQMCLKGQQQTKMHFPSELISWVLLTPHTGYPCNENNNPCFAKLL